jgi:hypothetical protein
MPFLTREFFCNAPRFWPVFVGVRRFVWTRFAGTKLDDRMALVKEGFAAIAKALPCRAHGVALQIIFERGSTALDLAQFDTDYEESERIVKEVIARM